jgi:uncharacterized membrane protein
MSSRQYPRTITALFRQCSEAIEVYQWLRKHGYHDGQINVLLSDRTQKEFHDAAHDDHLENKIVSVPGAEGHGAVGVIAGAALFAVAGAVLASLGFLAGEPYLAALAGGGVGAMVGGLVGGLIGYGFPDRSAREYDQALKEGGVAIGVTPRHDRDAVEVLNEFRRHHGEHIIAA